MAAYHINGYLAQEKAISTCLADSAKSRFALIKNGNELYCYEDIDFAKLQSVPDQNDTLVCSSFCAGGNEYVCGGENAVTIYVASKICVNILKFP